MHASVFDVICLLCGYQTGRVVENRYQPSGECTSGVSVSDMRKLRCCRCGGSVYLEASEQPTPGSLVWDDKKRAVV
jgi:hypothetical protein